MKAYFEAPLLLSISVFTPRLFKISPVGGDMTLQKLTQKYNNNLLPLFDLTSLQQNNVSLPLCVILKGKRNLGVSDTFSVA